MFEAFIANSMLVCVTLVRFYIQKSLKPDLQGGTGFNLQRVHFWASVQENVRPSLCAAASNSSEAAQAPRCPRGPVGIAALLCRGQTVGGGSIPRWSASKPQVTRRKPDGAVQKKKEAAQAPTTLSSALLELQQ